MKTLKVIVVSVDFHPLAILQLTEEQYKARQHNLKPLRGDLYEVVNTVQFKQGEEIGYDGEISKRLLEDVGEVIRQSQKENIHEEIDINSMLKSELEEALIEYGVEIPKKANKTELIALLIEAKEGGDLPDHQEEKKEIDINSMLKSELKKALDMHGVKIPKWANRTKLITLLIKTETDRNPKE